MIVWFSSVTTSRPPPAARAMAVWSSSGRLRGLLTPILALSAAPASAETYPTRAITIITPIFHRLSRDDLAGEGDGTKSGRRRLWATVTCPECGATQPNSQTETTCDRCGCRFVVRILAKGSS